MNRKWSWSLHLAALAGWPQDFEEDSSCELCPD